SQIRAAFPSVPYPGDHILSNCWCDECAWSVRKLRGKSWKKLRLEDLGSSDGGAMSPRGFRYFLPGLLCLAVQHPESDAGSEIVGGLVVSDAEHSPKAIDLRNQTLVGLSLRQRRVILEFLLWLGKQKWTAPILFEAAIKNVR